MSTQLPGLRPISQSVTIQPAAGHLLFLFSWRSLPWFQSLLRGTPSPGLCCAFLVCTKASPVCVCASLFCLSFC